MTARLIEGRKIARAIRREVASQVSELVSEGVRPTFAAVIVGDDPASVLYVESIKGRAAEAAGIGPSIHRLPEKSSLGEVLDLIARLNADPGVHGILIQLPLPTHLDDIEVQSAVDPLKDVDGLHPQNAGLLALGRPRFIPCTPLGVQILLERSGIKVEGSHVVVVGRSNLVGRPLSILLSAKREGANATVTLCHTGTVDLASHTQTADILIVAAGAAKAITAKMVKPGATVVDVGTNRTNEGLVGDVDFESVSEVAGAITPVPGGVGPMTVAMLLHNTVQAARLSCGRS